MSLLIGEEKAYAGTYEVPAWVEKEILRVGGKDTTGKPRFRVIWGANRLIANDEGLLIHPYQQNRWHLEKLLNGEYEHCWVLSHCPHSKGAWCQSCFKSGGEFIGIHEGYRIVEQAIRLIQMSAEFQNKTLQRAALMEREEEKQRASGERMFDLVKDALPKTIKRSASPNLTLTAQEALGHKPGLRQMTQEEVCRKQE